jgi:uncharacterized protein YjbI with pentapeptide repeats
VDLEPLENGELTSGTELEAVRADGTLAVAQTAYDVVIKECELDGVDLRDRRLTGMRCTDVRFVGCELAGAILQDAVLTRVQFVRCRLTGAQLSGAELQDVQITDCVSNLLAVRMASANYLWVTGSALREADFYEATLASSRITDCDLTAADFSGAKVPELDLRGSTLESVVNPSSLRGAVISQEQLFELSGPFATEAGITVLAD